MIGTEQRHTRRGQAALACALALAFAAPAVAQAEGGQGASPERLQGRPFVPKHQGPASPEVGGLAPEIQVLGFSLLGAGAFAGGLGLFMLETRGVEDCRASPGASGCIQSADSNARIELGAGLLIGGVFVAGLGLYLVVSEGTSSGPIITTPGIFKSGAPTWRLGLLPTSGGALLSSDLQF